MFQSNGRLGGPLDVHASQSRAWWLQLLAGQLEQSHPTFGTDIRAKVEDGVLRLTGVVPSQQDLDQLLAEADEFKGRGIKEIDSHIRVEETTEVQGLYMQTLMAVFESADQAAFAAGYLETHAHVEPHFLTVIEPGTGAAAVGLLVPADHVDDVSRALKEGKAILVVTIDETAAFRARQLLEEETRSLLVISAPPQVAPGGKQRLEEAESN
jgi:hypothetical protein